jgi:hypothetical protein
MNGICRSFPQSILELLRGSGTTGDNKLCTTLFCISSALKKLSQTTPLPETRSADLRLVSMKYCFATDYPGFEITRFCNHMPKEWDRVISR